MKQNSKYGYIFLFLFINAIGFSQISFDNLQIINSKSSLPSDRVTAIIKDDQGFMWLATENGLCRWDGISAKTFQHNDADSNSISGNKISRNSLLFDTISKQIIFGTDNGLSIFDPNGMKFVNYQANKNGSPDFLSKINVVYIDRQGVLWIGTSMGLARCGNLNGSHRSLVINQNSLFVPSIDNKGSHNVFDIKQDVINDSILWLATLNGLLKFNKHTYKFSRFYLMAKKYRAELNAFNIIKTHTNRKLYLGTWNSDMVVFNTLTGQFELQFGPYSSDKSSLFPAPVIPFSQKSKNEIWVSSKEGIGFFDTEKNKIHILHKFKNDAGRGYSPDIAFVEDNKTLWLASEYGAIKINMDKSFFQNYFLEPVDEKHWFLPTSFFEDTLTNRLYIGFARGLGLHYFDLQTNTFHYIPLPKKKSDEINIFSIHPLDSKKLLILCSDEIYYLSREGGKLVPLKIDLNEVHRFTDMAAGDSESFWIAGSNIGLISLNVKTGKTNQVKILNKYFSEKGLLPMIRKIAIDKHNRIWFKNNVSYGFYNHENGNFRFFDGPKKMTLLSFYQDKSDTIWTGTYKNGLAYINPDEPEKGVQTVTSELTKSVLSLQGDSNGDFYLLTADGIEKLSPDKRRSTIFNEEEGLVKYDKWYNRDPSITGILTRLSDGRFVIIYRRGLGFFNPDSLRKADINIKPYISSVKIFDKEFYVKETPFSLRKLDLNYDQNFISFEYSALALNNGKDILFSHKLTGVDREWITTNNRNVNYSNLNPGKYMFIVKAANKSVPDDITQTILEIIIHPPWWKSWWAYSLYAFTFVFIAYSIYNYQLKRELDRKETEKLKDINNLKSKLYTNITHEFRTPLTVIRGMTDEMRSNLSDTEQEHCDNKLEMIERNSDKLLHLVQQMLDMSKIEEGKMTVDLIQDNIVSYLQYVLESFQSMADAKKIKLVFYHETDKVMMDYDQDKIFIIASNLLSNAIKFTPVGGKVIFHVKREEKLESNHFIIKVQDSGIGIEEQYLQHIFDRFYQVDNSSTRITQGTGIGLALTKELVEILSGDITVKSNPGKGTEFCVSLPITNKAPVRKSKPLIIQPSVEQVSTVDLITEDDSDGGLPLALVVEDNPDVAKYIMSCLTGKYRVKWSPDGKQGIEAAILAIPDIIISDVMMPGKDGFEVCEKLKTDERTSHIPIILLTAKATDKDRIEGLSHGADAYLTKPFNKEELFVRLEQLIKIRRQLQEKYNKVEISLTGKKQPEGEEVFLKKAVEAIKKQMDNPELDPVLLAKSLNLSESQLYRKLKALNGRSTAVFIRSIRLSAAKELLATTSMNISEVAYRCGFSNPAWFSRTFKDEFGISPSKYRK